MDNKFSIIQSDSTQLLAHLTTVFPLLNPSVNDGLSSIQRKAGQQDVLAYIKRKLEEENEDNSALTTTKFN